MSFNACRKPAKAKLWGPLSVIVTMLILITQIATAAYSPTMVEDVPQTSSKVPTLRLVHFVNQNANH